MAIFLKTTQTALIKLRYLWTPYPEKKLNSWHLQENWGGSPNAACQLFRKGFAYQADFAVVRHSATNRGLPGNIIFYFKGYVVKASRLF
jgi:hypothetical protein